MIESKQNSEITLPEQCNSIIELCALINTSRNSLEALEVLTNAYIDFHSKNENENEEVWDKDEKENTKELIVKNCFYAMSIQIHSLADITSQVINELFLANVFKISECSLENVRKKLRAQSSGLTETDLSCFDSNEFKYFADVSNFLKHQGIVDIKFEGMVVNNKLEEGLSIEMFVKHKKNNQQLVPAKFIKDIIKDYDTFKQEYNKLIDRIKIESQKLNK